MARLRPRGNILPMLAVMGAGLGTSILAIVSMLSMDVPEAEPYVARPFVIETNTTLDGRGVQTKAPEGTSLLFVGDIMLGREVANRMRRSDNPAYPFEKMPEDWIRGFDFAIGNLEGPVTDSWRTPQKTIDFLFEPSVIPMLKEQGFDAFSQANNHAFDQGRAGYEDSMERLRSAGFVVFGEQVRDGEEALAFAEVNDRQIAFLGFNTTDNTLDRQAAGQIIEAARASAEQVIVMMHWGPEYRSHPHPKDVETAHWLIDQGADMIIGGHPHWEQGISVYKGKPIAWSLGNFIFDQDWSIKTREGLTLGVTLYSQKTEIELIPVSIIRSRPEIVIGDERRRRLKNLAEISDEALREQISDGKVILNH